MKRSGGAKKYLNDICQTLSFNYFVFSLKFLGFFQLLLFAEYRKSYLIIMKADENEI